MTAIERVTQWFVWAIAGFTVVFLIPIAATVLAAAWAGGPTYP